VTVAVTKAVTVAVTKAVTVAVIVARESYGSLRSQWTAKAADKQCLASVGPDWGD
jgi:hypothetical protein